MVEELEKQAADFDLVLAIPRGGVIAAQIIARYFHQEMDIILSRKIGSPIDLDPALGAVAPDGKVYMYARSPAASLMDEDTFRRRVEETYRELSRLTALYRGTRPPVSLEGRRVLLVDDGIVTGSTVAASVDYLQRMGAAAIFIATPVCAPQAYRSLLTQVAGLVALEIPDQMLAVGQFYEDFTALEDDEVMALLRPSL